MTRWLLFEKCLPKEYCAEAVHTAIFLLNRLPIKVVEGKTPLQQGYRVFQPHTRKILISRDVHFIEDEQ
ncbi:Retrovirus-related Pol polyprotein from transposon TNT 1-94 [Gossypium australe]|uniref:Retrovirus-related Pol polyprotein from transposon TNT 1-94 n=1 Tax=Gossypium australe TaxID=47621 RepID=A0A5B6VE69_9ROSI|nr:Retrovirus-related Pol polyprotein from transposon TNT 1-94 [Gossypium australe]